MCEQGIDRIACAVDQVEHALGKAGLEEELGQALRAKRRPLRGLEHERVAGDHREREHPQRDHHWEVERWDPCAHSDWVAVEVLVDAARDIPQRPTLKMSLIPI